MYKTKMGDEGREMVQIPEGPFIMGSKDGDPDEVPEHQVLLEGVLSRSERSDSGRVHAVRQDDEAAGCPRSKCLKTISRNY